MSPTLILFRKSLTIYTRSKAALIVTFLVPIVLIYLFGHVFGLYGRDPGPTGIPLAIVNASSNPAARQLIDRLAAEPTLRLIRDVARPDGSRRPLTETDVRAGLDANRYRFALLLPHDFIPEDDFGLRLKFLTNPRNEIEAQTVTGLLQKNIYSSLPTLLGPALQQRALTHLGSDRLERFHGSLADALSDAFGGDRAAIRRRLAAGDYLSLAGRAASPAPAAGSPAPAVTSNADADIFSRLVHVEVEQLAGKETKNPMAARLVGGYAIMFLLFAVSASSTSFFEEKATGVFQRLLASPVRPAHIIGAKFLFGMFLGLVQISALFLAGRLFFSLEIFEHAGGLFAVALSSAAACSAFGLLIASLAPNPAAASGLATLIVLSMSAIGGAWFPVSLMPESIQAVSKFTLVYWSVEGFTDVLWAGRPFLAVLPKVGILCAIAATVLTFSTWRFNRSKFFE